MNANANEKKYVRKCVRKKYFVLKCKDICVTIYLKRCIYMEKTATLNLRVNPAVKNQAEEVLTRLGIPMSTAIDIYLNQIILTGGIPFEVSLPKIPVEVNMDLMTNEEISSNIKKGFEDAKNGNMIDAKTAFKTLSDKYGI